VGGRPATSKFEPIALYHLFKIEHSNHVTSRGTAQSCATKGAPCRRQTRASTKTEFSGLDLSISEPLALTLPTARGAVHIITVNATPARYGHSMGWSR
jgi:hypothetical protein